MEHLIYIKKYLSQSIEVKKNLINELDILTEISNAANIIIEKLKEGRKVLLAGNGGSAADAQHIAAEFVSRFFYDRPGLPAIALTTDTSMLTAIGNDYGFEKIFARQLQAQANNGDVFIGISTSGESGNIVKAVEMAKDVGVTSIVLSGSKGILKEIADISICIPSTVTPYIQESHICVGHMICAIVESSIFPEREYR